jgi:hypothetical protein
MGRPNQGQEASIYRIRVKNHLGADWEHWFDGFTITHHKDGVTVLTGEVVDQSALYGLLQKLQNLNMALLSVQQIENDDAER